MSHWIASLAAMVCSRILSAGRRDRLSLTPEDLTALRLSFSQFGEDLIIAEHLVNLRRPSRGIYIDAGCFDPSRFSNTRLLSLMGWKGLNVDASEEVVERFRKARPSDETVCAALSDTAEANEFVQTPGGAGSRLARGAVPLPAHAAIRSRHSIVTRTLEDVVDHSRFASEPVDLLDIDCEGADLAVLRGFGLAKRRPVLICIEAHSDGEKTEIRSYLEGQSYTYLCRRGPSLLFRDTHTIQQP
ncbi:MAG: hypothetical protein Fur0032_01680 [Terrimicrobiaceae bacterium]